MQPRPSATVILARAAPGGFDLFMARRQPTASAFADAYVFPGGTVRADDLVAPDESPAEVGHRKTTGGTARADDQVAPGRFDALAELTHRGGTPPATAAEALALYRAAIRELFEEAGVLLAVDADGTPPAIADPEAGDWRGRREALQRGELCLDALLRELGLRPAFERLHYFSHWITPIGQPRRFDTRFFVAALPPGQSASHCGVETTDGLWIGPHEALGRDAAGAFRLVFPTRMHLQRLTGPHSLAELLELAATKPIATIQPGRPGEEVGAAW